MAKNRAKKPEFEMVQPDGRDIEFSQELADVDDLEAQERSKAADARAKSRKR